MSSDQHHSPIKTPRQLVTAILLAFVVPVIVIVLLVAYVTGTKGGGAGSSANTPEAIAERLRPVGTVAFKAAASSGPAVAQTGEAVYKSACTVCHGAGVAGAPKSGDAAAWAPRLAQGYDTLVKHAVQGFKGMPAKGGNAALSDYEVARAVVYMANAAGGKFAEPAAPTAAPAAASGATAPAAPAGAAAPAAAAAVVATAASASATGAPATLAPAPAAAAAVVAKADPAAGKKLYDTACMACHATGAAGAPKLGDKAAWAPRVKTGLDALVASAIKGKGAMPPKGGSTASDADVRAAVEYMLAAVK